MLSELFDLTHVAINNQSSGDAKLARQALKKAKEAISNAATEPAEADGTETASHLDDLDSNTSPQPITLHLNILKEGKRLLPQVKVAAVQYDDWEKVLRNTESLCGDDAMASAKMMVLLPDGLVEIKDDAGWKGALKEVESLDWMDGVMTAVVEL